jgi:hypothetical protein
MERKKKMEILVILLTIGLVIGGIAAFMKISPAKSKLQVTGDESNFPIVSGFNLNRQELVLPKDFEGQLNLVLVAFQQSQQAVVNTWLPFAQNLESEMPGFMYYELPTIYEMPSFSRTFINEGMRAGIPDPTARERTITLYIDKETFKAGLGISSEQQISVFLVDSGGKILWREVGSFTESKADGLAAVINEQLKD